MLKRVICVLFGLTCLGFGIALTMFSSLGSDPLATFINNLAFLGNVGYSVAYIFVNIILFLFMFIYLRNKINIGTILALFVLGYITEMFSNLLGTIPFNVEITSSIIFKIICVIIGITFNTFGLALYSESNIGLSPYDSFPLVLDKMIKSLNFTVAKILFDLLLVVLSIVLYVINKTIGHPYYLPTIITLISIIIYGPMISFFSLVINKTIFKGSKRVLK